MLEHHGMHMKNTVETIAGHEDGDPAELVACDRGSGQINSS